MTENAKCWAVHCRLTTKSSRAQSSNNNCVRRRPADPHFPRNYKEREQEGANGEKENEGERKKQESEIRNRSEIRTK